MNKTMEQIKNLLQENKTMHLKDFYNKIDKRKESIRSTLNLSVKKGLLYRIDKGTYSLYNINVDEVRQ
jgi:predicted transcriptional regulator of viral defense system